MKGCLVLGIGVAVLIAIAGGFFLTKSSDQTQSHREVASFLVTALRSDVALKDVDKDEFVPVAENSEAHEGASVKTSLSGRAIIESSKGVTTVIDRNSEMVIEENASTASKTSVRLVAGNVWSRLEKTLGQGEFYEIQTQNAVATVRGTSFGTSFVDATTTFLVTHGAVTIFLLDEYGEMIPDSERIVSAGEKAVIETGKGIVITAISAADRNTEWYQFNNPTEAKETQTQNNEQNQTQDHTTISEVSPVEGEIVEEETTESETNTPTSNTEPESTKPIISEVVPSEVLFDRNNSELPKVTLRGKYLEDIVSVRVGYRDVAVFTIESSTSLFFALEREQLDGTFDISIANVQGETATLENGLTVISPKEQDPPAQEPTYPTEPASTIFSRPIFYQNTGNTDSVQ